MTTAEFLAIYGDLRRLGFIEEKSPGRWMPTATGARTAQKVILTILACPNDGTPEELDSLQFAAETLRDLAKVLERRG